MVHCFAQGHVFASTFLAHRIIDYQARLSPLQFSSGHNVHVPSCQHRSQTHKAQPLNNGIVLVGGSGAGKSYLGNEFLQLCGSPVEFEEGENSSSVTEELQHAHVNFKGSEFTVCDTPGFYDRRQHSNRSNDGKNTCQLVKLLENIENLYAIIFVISDRFLMPQKMWFDRILQIIGKHHHTNILIVKNKTLGKFDDKTRESFEKDIQEYCGHKQAFHVIHANAQQSEIGELFERVAAFTPLKLENLKVPEVCYERTIEGTPYEEEIERETVDEGVWVTEERQETVYVRKEKWNPDSIGGWFGLKHFNPKVSWNEPETRTLTNKVWKPHLVTRREVATFIDVFNVRFDGTKDLKEKREIKRRVE